VFESNAAQVCAGSGPNDKASVAPGEADVCLADLNAEAAHCQLQLYVVGHGRARWARQEIDLGDQ
jgi:hypothetical protein